MSNPITPTVAETLLLTDTTANALVVGGAIGATTGTGGIKAGPIVSSSSVADSVGTMATIRAGGLSVASQAAGDLLAASSTTQFARLAKGTALQVLRMNSGATAQEYATLPYTRLTSNSGTNTNAAAANMDTLALSGLNAGDRLLVLWKLEAATQDITGPIMLYSTTDSAVVTNVIAAAAGVAAGETITGVCYLTPSQVNVKKVGAINTYVTFSSGAIANFASVAPTLATNFTSPWTIAFRHTGVVAGGTAYWQWSIFLLSAA